MDPLGSLLFPKHSIVRNMVTRSEHSDKAKQPVPGCRNLAANLMARAWNETSQVQNASSLGAAKIAARKWAKSIQLKV